MDCQVGCDLGVNMSYTNNGKLKVTPGRVDKDVVRRVFERCNRNYVEFQDVVEAIIDRINDTEAKKEEAYKQLEEWNKDEEIQELKNKIESLQDKLNNIKKYSFEITPEEHEAIEKWKKKYVEEKHNGDSYAGAIGGRYKYIFVPTPIGTVGSIKCSCGETFCFSELW